MDEYKKHPIDLQELETLAVVAGSLIEYKGYVKGDLIPILEQYHQVKFIKNHADQSYQVPGRFKILYLSNVRQMLELKNYQLVKCGRFAHRKDLEEIEEIYKVEVLRRQAIAKARRAPSMER